MHAIQIDGAALRWGETDRPQLGAGEIRIQVHASAANRADLAQRAGSYPPPPGASPILGLECAGEVTELGEGVTRFSVGDAVCALLAGGGYAEEVVVAAGQALPVPRGLSMVEAAAVPEVFATAYLNLFMEAELRRGERALLHAGASGVGTAAIQLCKAFDNPCYVTVGSQNKLDACLALGAAGGWLRSEGSFVDPVTQWSEGQGVDAVLDPVGGAYLEDNLKVLRQDGRLVVIGLMGGARTEINLGLMMIKRLRLIGSTLRARSVPAKAAVMDALYDEVWPLIENGQIRPIVDRVFPIAEASAAHEAMAADENVGKLVLKVRE
ncbi:MAG: NAD(P)H-quinone oxidoreductase [Pseudomonadota bacterium]